MATILFMALASIAGFLVVILYLLNSPPSGRSAGAAREPRAESPPGPENDRGEEKALS